MILLLEVLVFEVEPLAIVLIAEVKKMCWSMSEVSDAAEVDSILGVALDLRGCAGGGVQRLQFERSSEPLFVWM